MSAVPILKRILAHGFFGIVMEAWLLKLVVFSVLIVLLKDQPWIQTQVLFLATVVAMIGTLVMDVVALARAGWTTEDRSHQASRTDRTLVQVEGSSS